MGHVVIAGQGYLGNRIARDLRRANTPVVGLRRSAVDGVRAADLTDRASVQHALEDLDVSAVVYCASADGRSVDAYRAAYVEGLRTMLEVAPDAYVVFVSSTAVYGQSSGFVDHASETKPSSPTAPVLVEAEAPALGRGALLPLAALYGPPRPRLLPRRRCCTPPGPPPFPHRTPPAHASTAVIAALTHRPTGPFIGVDDDTAPLSEVAAYFASFFDVKAPVIKGPPVGKRCRNDALRGLGWVPRYPSFREGYVDVARELAQ